LWFHLKLREGISFPPSPAHIIVEGKYLIRILARFGAFAYGKVVGMALVEVLKAAELY
jgi:hypothetical protein